MPLAPPVTSARRRGGSAATEHRLAALDHGVQTLKRVRHAGQPGLQAVLLRHAVVHAIKIAVDDIKAEKLMGDDTLTMLYEDNRSDKQEAIGLLTRMATRDGIIAFIGPVSSGEAMAVAPVAVELKVPMFTTATTPDVLKAGPWVFKSSEAAETYMNTLGALIADKVKPKACFLVYIRDNDGYIRQTTIFRDRIKQGGVGIAAEESILAADSDFTALATKIASSGADCLFLSTPPDQGANIILQSRQAGMAASTVLVGNTGMGSDRYVKTGGKAVDGTYFPVEFDPSGVNDEAKRFVADYTKRYGSAPDAFAASGYTMTVLIARAIKKAGPHPTREAVRDAMAATKDMPAIVGRGTFSFDKDRIPVFGASVLVIRDGKPVRP